MTDLLTAMRADLDAQIASADETLAAIERQIAALEGRRRTETAVRAALVGIIERMPADTPALPAPSPRAAPGSVPAAIIAALAERGGGASLDALAERTGHKRESIGTALRALVKAKRVTAAPGGLYWLAGPVAEQAAAE